ncbi:MAG: 5-(carboxyamino)imidazole ribonucleotide mutase [Acidobacteriota bacterium]|nr:MAG: 5-(carboxyamino)imidazole ribonucleotide mutase [Acidobacteriota bacterium]
MTTPKVAILMGSKSDAEVMKAASKILDDFGVAHEMRVLSAHRTPADTQAYIAAAEDRGIEVFIAGAGFAAHLAGAVAAHSVLPVIGVPIDSSPLAGVDALYSTVQMPGGIPVATMTIGKSGAKNAGLFAVQILSRKDPKLVSKLKDYRKQMRDDILAIEL